MVNSSTVYPASRSMGISKDVGRFRTTIVGLSNVSVLEISGEATGRAATVTPSVGDMSVIGVAEGRVTSGRLGCATDADTGSATEGASKEVKLNPLTGDGVGTTLAGGAAMPNSAAVV